jgi:hypothetical protein
MAVQHFDHNRPRSFISDKEVISTGKGIDRLWGISGGVLDLVAVIIQMEAGCWRGCCMIGSAMNREWRS